MEAQRRKKNCGVVSQSGGRKRKGVNPWQEKKKSNGDVLAPGSGRKGGTEG